MNYIVASFFIFIGILVLTIQNRHFKAAYSFAFMSGIVLLLLFETSFTDSSLTLLDTNVPILSLLLCLGFGIATPILFEGILRIIYRNRDKNKIGLDYDLITGVISFFQFGISAYLGYRIGSYLGLFSIAIGYWLVYTFLRFIIKHTRLIGTERNNSLAIMALLPVILNTLNIEELNLLEGNVMMGVVGGAIFVMINLVAGLLTEKLSLRYFVLFLSVGLFVLGGFGFFYMPFPEGMEMLAGGLFSVIVVTAFARSFGNPLRLINFNFNSLLFIFTGVILMLSEILA